MKEQNNNSLFYELMQTALGKRICLCNASNLGGLL